MQLKCYIESIYTDVILKQNKFTILSQFLSKKSKMVSFASSIMKHIEVLSC